MMEGKNIRHKEEKSKEDHLLERLSTLLKKKNQLDLLVKGESAVIEKDLADYGQKDDQLTTNQKILNPHEAIQVDMEGLLKEIREVKLALSMLNEDKL